MVEVREPPPGLSLPIPPPLGGLKAPPSRVKGGGGHMATTKCVTRRQMSPPPSAAACEVVGGALRDGEGLGQHQPGRRLSAAVWGHQHWPLGPVRTGSWWPS